MAATASNLCDACRNIDFDEMVIAPDVLEREQAYRDFHRIRGWSEESPERDHNNPPTWNPSEMRGYQLYPSFTEVRQSAEGGCELCRAISNEVPRYLDESKKMHRHPFGGNRLSNSFDPEGLAVHLSCPTSAERPGAEVWVILCWERYEDAPPSYVLAGAFSVWLELDDPLQSPVLCTGKPVDPDGRSSGVMRRVRDWFDKCCETHSLCGHGRDNAMPKRVIDVGPADDTCEPRLVETQTTRGDWCALSHAWGGKVALTTTRATLRDRIRGIAMSDLPLTFQDAIIISRVIGVRYLWIDSLCIIQDSEEDWVEESNRMGDIYKNSLLTISATTATNSKGGILVRRRSQFTPIRLLFRSQRFGFGGSLCIRHIFLSFDHAIEGTESPLAKRGWCLQERVLAPRTLHFGVEQMFWECREKKDPEGLPWDEQYGGDGLNYGIGWQWESNKLYFLPPEKVRDVFPDIGDMPGFKDGPTRPTGIKFQTNTDGLTPERAYLSWYGLVENFTSRDLTKEHDKLIAVSGLASEISRILGGDQYLAGLWRNDLLNELCWSPHFSRECKPPSTYRAPSWSWASLDGRLSYPHHHFKRSGTPANKMGDPYDEAEIVNVVVDSRHSFGPVTSGSLDLRSFFFSVRIDARAYFNRDPDTTFERMDVIKSAFKQSYIFMNPFHNEDGSICWVNNRSFKLVIFSEPHAFYNEEAIVPWTLGQDGTLVFQENKFALNPRGKIECTLDQVYDVSQFGEGPAWLEFFLVRITGRYFLMVQPTEDQKGIYKRIGLAAMGKYTVLPDEIPRRVGSFTIV